jgi:hypothetical protein
VSDYFFLLKISDWSKEYKPESKILMDIPSALNFFHKDPKFTLSMITSKVEKLANGWNSVFYKTDKEVGKQTSFPYKKTHIMYFNK